MLTKLKPLWYLNLKHHSPFWAKTHAILGGFYKEGHSVYLICRTEATNEWPAFDWLMEIAPLTKLICVGDMFYVDEEGYLAFEFLEAGDDFMVNGARFKKASIREMADWVNDDTFELEKI